MLVKPTPTARTACNGEQHIHFPTTLFHPLRPVPPYRCAARINGVFSDCAGEEMGIATDILNFRRNQFSSVETLIAALERCQDAPHEKVAARLFHVGEAADLVLTNIAAHAAEAMAALQSPSPRTQRVLSIRPKNRRFKSGSSALQRPLFSVGRLAS